MDTNNGITLCLTTKSTVCLSLLLLLPLCSKKRQQKCRTITLPSSMSDQDRKVLAPVVDVLLDIPTYLEVPDFQRVAIIGDYASGVLYLNYVAYISLLSRLVLWRTNLLCKRDLVQDVSGFEHDGPHS